MNSLQDLVSVYDLQKKKKLSEKYVLGKGWTDDSISQFKKSYNNPKLLVLPEIFAEYYPEENTTKQKLSKSQRKRLAIDEYILSLSKENTAQ